jgi:transcriptional regulator with XRE-family HTH domain
MVRIRKLRDARQDEFARVIGVQRSAYTRKETGDSIITLDDLEALSKHYKINLAEFFKGYEGFYFDGNTELNIKALSKLALENFPFLEQVITIANTVSSGKSTEEEKALLKAALRYAASKL